MPLHRFVFTHRFSAKPVPVTFAQDAPQAPGEKARMRGFTLIELLVSLTVMSIILALLSAGLRVMGKNWDANAGRIENLDMVSRAFDILQRDADHLQRVISASGNAQTFLFTGTAASMAFIVLEPPYPTQPGPYFVEYAVEAQGDAAELIRARAQYRQGMQQFPGATPANRVPLLQGRYQYAFSYGQTSAGALNWYADWPHSDRLPELIRLEIIAAAPNEMPAPAMIVRIRADAELSCLSEQVALCSPMTGGALKAVPARAPAKNQQDTSNG